MHAICYKNTKTTLPNWIDSLHKSQQYGYAYETNTHFIHLYGKAENLYIISPGLTVCEKKNGTLKEWVERVFGATDIETMTNEVGYSIKGVWRPGLFYENEIYEALNCDEYERRSSEQALKILLEKLSDLLLYIEPDQNNLNVYSHKTRELLILACTEVENQWLSLFKKSNISSSCNRYTTNDYVKLNTRAFLYEYQVKYHNYRNISPMQPFKDWDASNPTQSLVWYDAYNKTKHNRDGSFSESKLEHVLSAIAANIVLHCVRFSPFGLYNNSTTLSGFINQMVNISLLNSNRKSFYVPLIELPIDTREDLFCYNSYNSKHIKEWSPMDLVL